MSTSFNSDLRSPATSSRLQLGDVGGISRAIGSYSSKKSPEPLRRAIAECLSSSLLSVQGSSSTVVSEASRTLRPLTDFPSKKCKRRGFYEEEHIKFDDVFDEWEFCPDFSAFNGRYIRTNGKEFNATFLCPECVKHEYAVELQRVVRYLGVRNGNMQEGSLRCDMNVSIRPIG